MPFRDEKARRVILAVLENIANWEARAEAIADNCPPGCKHDALSLAKDLEQARLSLERLVQRSEKAGEGRAPSGA